MSFAAVPLVGNTRPHPGVALEVDELGTVLKEARETIGESQNYSTAERGRGHELEFIADTMDCHLDTVVVVYHARKNLQKVSNLTWMIRAFPG